MSEIINFVDREKALSTHERRAYGDTAADSPRVPAPGRGDGSTAVEIYSWKMTESFVHMQTERNEKRRRTAKGQPEQDLLVFYCEFAMFGLWWP